MVQGTIPQALGGLTELRQLGLGRNQLTGQLPAFLGALPLLSSVWLEDNRFSGLVPQAWCDQGSNAAFTVHLEVRAVMAGNPLGAPGCPPASWPCLTKAGMPGCMHRMPAWCTLAGAL